MRRIVLCLFVVLTFCISIDAQNNSFENLLRFTKNINQFYELNPQEKVYLHFDNTGYYLGETIWFKAYVVLSGNNNPEPLSKLLHVELLTPEGEIIESKKLRIENGQCHGEFLFNEEYRSGFYEIRAYTRGMLNFGEQCIFSRVFPVYEKPEEDGAYSEKVISQSYSLEKKRKAAAKLKDVNLSFYPEGGNLIEGLLCRIGFKATGNKGEDINIQGSVYNSAGDLKATFSVSDQGMGIFDLMPDKDQYMAEIEYENKKYTFPLPMVQTSGCVMQVNNAGEKDIKIFLQKSTLIETDSIGLSVSCRGKIYQINIFNINTIPPVIRISRDSLPTGCIQATFFSPQGKIFSERLFFNINKSIQNYIPISVKQDKEKYHPFEKINLEFSGDIVPKETTFSLTIRDVDAGIYNNYQGNILTDLLLSSDIKGYIENPMQYFVQNDSVTRQKLDLLTMIQGWRRYDWMQMTGITPFEVKHYIEEGLPINGKVLEMGRNKGRKNTDVMLWIMKDGGLFKGKTATNVSGNFYFLFPDEANVYGKWLLGIQASEKDKRKHARITLDRNFSPPPKAYTIHDIAVKDTLFVLEEIKEKRPISEMQLLDHIVIKGKRKRGKPKPDIILNVEKDINTFMDNGEFLPTIGDYMERVLINLVKNEGFGQDTVIDDSYIGLEGQDFAYRFGNRNIYFCVNHVTPKIYRKVEQRAITTIDISAVSQIDIYHSNERAWIQVIDPSDRCYHESITPAVFFHIKLYNDKFRDENIKGIRYTPFYGYSKAKEFYHVNNSYKQLGDVDFRRTLYWNPNVKMDDEGNAKVSFYNNSSSGRIKISAEGISKNGIPIILK